MAVPVRNIVRSVAADFACIYLFVGLIFIGVSAYGGLLFIDTETSVVVEALLDDDVVIEAIIEEEGSAGGIRASPWERLGDF